MNVWAGAVLNGQQLLDGQSPDAVLNQPRVWPSEDDSKDPPTQAVLTVLHDTGSWFCRLSEDEAGYTVETPYPVVQPTLF